MPSIFEKPSILGFRQEGGRVPIPRNPYSSVVFTDPKDAERYTKAAGEDWVDIPVGDPRYDAIKRAAESGDFTAALNPSQYFQGAQSSVGFMPGFPGGYASPGERVAGDRAAMERLAKLGIIEKVQDISQPGEPTPTYRVRKSFLEGNFGPPADMSSMFVGPAAALADGTLPARPAPTPTAAPVTPATPVTTPPSIFGPPAPGEQIFGPPSILANQQPGGGAPGGTRAERVAAAIASGDFAEKQRQYNQEAMRMGSPTMMDAQGNIVGRELTEAERMREFFKTTGGNTMFSQTTDPAQRALQNEMMKQARAQATVNTFGTTPEERLANLQAETDARKILQSPLNSGVREVAPGVRAATRDGQTVGFSAPGDGSPATMNDPLKKYITNPDGSVSLNPNPPQILMSDEMKDTAVRQGIEGKTGGSPMERGLIAAMAAEEERKKKIAERAESSRQGAILSPQIASNIARGFSPGAQVGGFVNEAMQQARK